MAAEKMFEWIMKLILSRNGDGPFGIVEDYKKNIRNMGQLIDTCFCGASQEVFHSIALWLSFRVVLKQMTQSLHTYGK